jgi:hypothetical protein
MPRNLLWAVLAIRPARVIAPLALNLPRAGITNIEIASPNCQGGA